MHEIQLTYPLRNADNISNSKFPPSCIQCLNWKQKPKTSIPLKALVVTALTQDTYSFQINPSIRNWKKTLYSKPILDWRKGGVGRWGRKSSLLFHKIWAGTSMKCVWGDIRFTWQGFGTTWGAAGVDSVKRHHQCPCMRESQIQAAPKGPTVRHS